MSLPEISKKHKEINIIITLFETKQATEKAILRGKYHFQSK